jgi:hypothetical protein
MSCNSSGKLLQAILLIHIFLFLLMALFILKLSIYVINLWSDVYWVLLQVIKLFTLKSTSIKNPHFHIWSQCIKICFGIVWKITKNIFKFSFICRVDLFNIYIVVFICYFLIKCMVSYCLYETHKYFLKTFI